MTAAKAAAERAGAPLVLTHVSTSHWGANVPAFHADADETARVVEHGPPAQRILAVADGHDAALIVLGTRAMRWRASVARHVAKRARCPVMIVGPHADPEAEPVTRPAFDRALPGARKTPVVVVPPPVIGEPPGSKAAAPDGHTGGHVVVLARRDRQCRPAGRGRRRARDQPGERQRGADGRGDRGADRRHRARDRAQRAAAAAHLRPARAVDRHDAARRPARSRAAACDPQRPAAEVGELAKAFNDMLDRLEAERQGSARRALAATEAERVRVARELHDQVGQTLTGVVLALEEIHRRAPADLGRTSRRSRRRRAPVSSRCARSRAGCARARWRSSACAAR